MEGKQYSTNQWITEEIKQGTEKYLEINENESTMIQNLWDAVIAILRGKFIARNKQNLK